LDSIERINEEDTESISSEGSYLEIGVQVLNNSVQVQVRRTMKHIAILCPRLGAE